METFAELREYVSQNHLLFHDEPFLLGFECRLDSGRRQNLFLAELKSTDNRRYLRLETTVVPLTQLDPEKCLRINLIQRIGYLAVGDLDGTPYVKMCHNIPYRSLNMDELEYIIGQIANRADRFEDVIAEGDDLS